jgi:hypothetical protein
MSNGTNITDWLKEHGINVGSSQEDYAKAIRCYDLATGASIPRGSSAADIAQVLRLKEDDELVRWLHEHLSQP